MKGIVDVRNACSRVASSQILAQLSSFGLNLSIRISVFGVRHTAMFLGLAQRDPAGLI
jgi:hypothetical protein